MLGRLETRLARRLEVEQQYNNDMPIEHPTIGGVASNALEADRKHSPGRSSTRDFPSICLSPSETEGALAVDRIQTTTKQRGGRRQQLGQQCWFACVLVIIGNVG